MTSKALEAAATVYWERIRSPTDPREFHELTPNGQNGICLIVASIIRIFGQNLSHEAVEACNKDCDENYVTWVPSRNDIMNALEKDLECSAKH